MKQGLSNLFGTRSVSLINDGDKERVNDYFRVLKETGDKALAYQSTLNGASNATKQIALTSANATVAQEAMANATTKVTLAEKTAAVGAKALGVALNTAFNIGVSLAISLAIKGITKLINAEKEAREKAVKIAEAYKSEQQENDKLVRQYVEIAAITTNLTNEKDKLLSVQEKLNENVSDQKKQYDLLNGSLAENLKLAREQELQDAKRTKIDLQDDYDKAVETMSEDHRIYITGTSGEQKKWKDFYHAIQKELEDNIVFTDGGWNNSDTIEFRQFNQQTGKWENDLRVQVDYLNEAIAIYSELETADKQFLERLKKRRDNLENDLIPSEEIISQVELAQKIIDSYEVPKDVQKNYDNILNQIQETSKKAYELSQNNSDPIALSETNNELRDLIGNLYNAAEGYDGLKAQADLLSASVSDSLNIDVSASSKSIKDFASVFSEYLDSSFKDTLSNIEKVESAMQMLANGDSLDWETFKELNWDIDVDHILGAFNQVDDGYTRLNGDLSDLIKLKDNIINQQIQTIQNQISGEEGMTVRLTELQADLKILEEKLSHSQNESDAKYYKGLIAEKKQDIKDINHTISDNNTLIKEFKRHLGDTVDHAEALNKQLDKLNEQLDEAQKKADAHSEAFTAKIDSIIDGLEEQKDVLESQKDAMEEQLDVLESQQEALEETIDNYKKIAEVVNSAVDDEIELLKEQQEAEEAAIQAKIDALKEAHEQQEEENSLIEKELTLQQKLRDLEKAKQTKVRTYSEARGWHYGTDKEAVVNAQTAVDEAQSDYDKAVADKKYNDQLDALEKEKELITENYEDQIKAYEDYYKQWKSIVDEQEEAENEQLAQQILGSDWREKIKNKDLQTLDNYRVGYQNYNTQLSNLVNVEITALKESIKAKEAEIKVIGNHITEWNKYKDTVTKAVNEIKGANEEYAQLMAQIPLDENSSYEQRLNALANFKNQFSIYTDEIAYYASQISNIEANINIDSNVHQVANEMGDFFDTYRAAMSAIGSGIVGQLQLANAVTALRGYSTGGTADSTGLAMLHGTKQKAETIFNAEQSKRLYDMVKTDSFSNLVAQRAVDGITRALGSNQTINNSSNVGSTIHIHEMVIKADNPTQFHDQFIREIGQYWKIKLAENRVK